MLENFVMTPRGLALDRLLVRWTGFSLTTWVFARANGFDPGPALYLETRGRKTGKTRGVVLPYFVIDGKSMVVGSKGGAPEDPYWAQNLRQNPDAVVYLKRKPHPVRARFTQGDERTRYWDALKNRIAAYRAYEQNTTREIPVIVLEGLQEPAASGNTH